MLDLEFIIENLELCKTAAQNKNRVVAWDELLTRVAERKEYLKEVEAIRAQRNIAAKESTQAAITLGKKLKESLKVAEEKLNKTEAALQVILLTIPNVPHPSVPVGLDESDNVEVKKVGSVPSFSFTPKDHISLGLAHDLFDFERGSKVSGFRGYFLKNEGALLEFAVLFYAFQKLIAKGYTPIIAPSLVREFTLFGNGQFPWGKDEVYALEKDNQYLAGTAEVPVTAYYSGEVLEEKDLPKKFVAFSPCFRREAGSYGKDTKGLYRVHQFNKIEQVIIAKHDMNNSLTLHEELLSNTEEIMNDLEIPYRVLLMCTGDMGEPQVKKYDIEAWMGGKGAYGETGSNSYMGDFQARRLKVRYKDSQGKISFCDTLNNTAVASPRILIPILENNQREDGSIGVPQVLQPFIGKTEIR